MSDTKIVFPRGQSIVFKVAATDEVRTVRLFDYDELVVLYKKFDLGEYRPIETDGYRLTVERQLWLNLAGQAGMAMLVKKDAPFLQTLRQGVIDEENMTLQAQTSEKPASE